MRWPEPKTKKHFFAMFKSNPQFFINFCFFSTCIVLLQLLGFAENTIKIVFSEEHSFSKIHLVKPTFRPSKKHLFKKKSHFWFFGQFPLKPLFLLCVLVFTVLAPKNFGPKQVVCTKMRLSPFPTQIVSGNFC